VLRKGLHGTIDSYSAFYENDRATPTGLTGYHRERGIWRSIFASGIRPKTRLRGRVHRRCLPRDRRCELGVGDLVELLPSA
jgi:hypothetical protein